ncbi:MAG: protein kinase [Planctomycetes bacterium]|nr:protein kinase [Planctomycetota bacterium]
MNGKASAQDWLKVDEFVAAFENAWTVAKPAAIADYLPPSSHPAYRETLLELVRVDLELRWEAGCALAIEAYCAAFPDLRLHGDSLSRIAFEEYRARLQRGELVSPQEYTDRYGVIIEAWPRVAAREASGAGHSRAGLLTDRSNGHNGGREGELPFPTAGMTFIDFRLLSELGRGAFSRVFLARQGELAQRRVVLKVSGNSFAEADKLAQLQHQHIVPIYSVHQAGPLSALCMPYFGSVTLSDVIREIHGRRQVPASGRDLVDTLTLGDLRTRAAHPARSVPGPSPVPRGEPFAADTFRAPTVPEQKTELPGELKTLSRFSYVEAVLWIGARLADGLQHSHERGIVHGDLKPANVLMADDGRPMLLDFNLSQDLKDAHRLRDLYVGGTLPYMAPEQLRSFQGQTAAPDPRSDLYSLGLILYELLAGTGPFPLRQGTLDELITALQADRRTVPAPVERHNAAITPAVSAIIRHCLEPDPGRRYQTAAALREDLERHLRSLPLRHIPEPSLRERVRKWSRRHTRSTTVLAVLLTVRGTSATFTHYQQQRRLAETAQQVEELVAGGRQALADGQPEVAHGRFRAAWQKVQGEPGLADQLLGVSGWLDQSHREVVQRNWSQRAHPREYEERRDEVLILSLGLKPAPDFPGPPVYQALQLAWDLTLPDDPGWSSERTLLQLVWSDVVEVDAGPAAALDHLAQYPELAAAEFHTRRANLLDSIGRASEAVEAREAAAEYPPDPFLGEFLAALDHARHRRFADALTPCERLLQRQPDCFRARLLQAICFLELHRFAEAQVGFTACVAQRPFCDWAAYFLSQARLALGDRSAARSGLEQILERRPTPALAVVTRDLYSEVLAAADDPGCLEASGGPAPLHPSPDSD